MSDTPPIEHPTWLTTVISPQADEPLRLFAAWFEEAQRLGAERSQRHGARHRRRRRPARTSRMVLMKGFDERGFVFYTNIDSHKGPRTRRTPEGRAAVSLEVARTGRCACAGPVERGDRRRGRRLFRDPPAAGPDRRLGQQAVGAAGKPPRVREGGRARTPPNTPSATVPRPPYWSGYRIVPAGDRVLARPAVPAARPHRVPRASTRTQPWSKTRLYP